MAQFIIIGPCALESIEQVKPIVDVAKKHWPVYFRANLFKPRTSPYSFQGAGRQGLPIIEYLLKHEMKLVCEAASLEQLELVKSYASIIQIGARNMQNFEFLKAIGKKVDFASSGQMVMLKRGIANTMEEWLSSAKYLEESGVAQEKIILCERGTRNMAAPSGVTLDLALAWKVRQETDYRVIIDPSHGTRESSLVLPLAKAAMAMDFDGIMIETHPQPLRSLSDPQQAVYPDALDGLLSKQYHNKERVNDRNHFPSYHS